MDKPKKSCCAAGHSSSKTTVREAGISGRKGSAEGMALLAGGSFLMGTNDSEGFSGDGEGPVREVMLNPFYIDLTAVTNSQFAAYVNDTGYKTDAEQYGWSFVFYQLLPRHVLAKQPQVSQQAPWWCARHCCTGPARSG